MNRRRAVAATAAVVAVAALGAWALLGDGDDDRLPPVGTLPLPADDLGAATDPAADPAAEELDALLRAGRGGAVHAVYESAGDTSELGGDLRLEVWRDGDRARYDNRLTTPAGTGDTVVVVGPDTTTTCSRVDDAPFTCTEAPAGADVADLILAGAVLEGRDVEAYDDEVGGVAARCFRVDDATGRASICVDASSVPLLLTIGDARLVRVALDDDVDDADLAPPSV